MPRKVHYGVDYDDDDEDYDYDCEYEEPTKVDAPLQKQETLKSGVWSCSICTFDNEESMSACDICGVLRNPLVKVHSNSDQPSVDGLRKDIGVSVMAKSLFTSFPSSSTLQFVPSTRHNVDLLSEISKRFSKLGNFNELHEASNLQKHNRYDIGRASLHCDLWIHAWETISLEIEGRLYTSDLPRPGNAGAFSTGSPTQCVSKLNCLDCKTVPFKFDLPSPDDLVSRGLRPLSEISKVNSNKLSFEDKPSKAKGKKIATESQSDAKSFEKSPVLWTAMHHSVENDANSSVNGGNRRSISGGLNNMALTVETGPSRSITAGRPASNAHYKPEKWMLPNQEEDELIQLNLAIVGHVDSGKSTLSGRLLHLLGLISQKQMHKYEKEAKAEGKGSFAYAWALDESAEERERGITMTVAVAYFNSKKYRVVLLDSPGHKDFVPNMIAGATQADAAILVIDASLGSFEAGIDINGGQTREHAQLIRSFGVDQLIVAINKMDIVGYSKERFGAIKQQLGTFLRSCGFKDSSILWVPLSAMENQNLVSSASDGRLLSWHKGPSLLDAIDSLQSPNRDYSKPLLMPICDVIKSQSQGQVALSGKLEAGALKGGSKVLLMPSGEIGTVRSLERDSQSCAIARAGDNVVLSLQGIDETHVLAGGVLCHPDFPVAVSNRLELKILMLDVASPILIGSQLELHIHHVKEAAKVVKILSLLDPKTGKETKKAPRILTAKQRALVEVAIQKGVCVEEFSSCKALGRVFLRASGKTIAVGVVTRVVKDQE